MKRKIKFRGKSITSGEWVYSMTISMGKVKLKSNQVFLEIDETNWVQVHPETVGQFTGLKDHKGNEIYEGDIFEVDRMTIVKYTVHWCNGEESGHEWYGATFILKRDEEVFFPFDDNAMQFGSVIGNIFDNPELINTSDEHND